MSKIVTMMVYPRTHARGEDDNWDGRQDDDEEEDEDDGWFG